MLSQILLRGGSHVRENYFLDFIFLVTTWRHTGESLFFSYYLTNISERSCLPFFVIPNPKWASHFIYFLVSEVTAFPGTGTKLLLVILSLVLALYSLSFGTGVRFCHYCIPLVAPHWTCCPVPSEEYGKIELMLCMQSFIISKIGINESQQQWRVIIYKYKR